MKGEKRFNSILFIFTCEILIFGHSQGPSLPSTNVDRVQTVNRDGTGVSKERSEQEMSLVINSQDRPISSFIQVVDPPPLIDNLQKLKVDYRCESEGHVGVEVRVWTDIHEDCMIFYETWTCSPHATRPLRKIVQLIFPESLTHKPSILNPKSHVVNKVSLKAWIVDKKVFKKTRKFIKKAYDVSLVRVSYSTSIKGPLERSDILINNCVHWYTSLRLKLPYTPKCQEEILVEKAITFPLVLSGSAHGVHRSYKKLKDPTLEAQRKKARKEPKFTIVTYVYLLKYCNSGLCSIMQKMTWNETYMTPLIFINRDGHLHVQITTADGRPMAFLTNDFKIPLKQWTRLIIRCKKQLVEVAADWGENWNQTFSTWYRFGMEDIVHFDDTQGLFIYGGTEITKSITGYIGEAFVYRTQAVPSKKIPYPSPYHPMFELDLTKREDRCTHFFEWIRYRIFQCKQLLQVVIKYRTCPYDFEDVFYAHPRQTFGIPQCTLYGGPRPKQYYHVNRMVRKLVLQKKNVSFKKVGQQLYKDALQMIEEQGFKVMKEVVPLLKQSSCYGNHDASFMLAAVWSKGAGVKSQELHAVSALMQGVLDGNRLCLMAMGNKHVFGLDGVSLDLEQAYAYYKNVADVTKWDREKHAEEDVFTESVRLTDEVALSAQTDEQGDLFQWFKHQAQQGMVHAQQNLGRLLFWGAQGVRRDLRQAAAYYRMGAERNDPQSLHDYGLVLLKGQGVDKNETLAIEYLKKSADLGHISALNALGWYALERERNATKAFGYFNASYNKGNADAAHNIGHMMQHGRLADGKVDKVNCFKYFAFAAARGQLDSALQVASMNMRGHPLTQGRDAHIAMDWARFVSEQNPIVGKILSKGLKAYQAQNWEAALMYYILAAESGLEVGNFNLAYLCEENIDGIVTHVQKELTWRHYNLSTQRYSHQVDPYSWIKMGDYFWYGCEGQRDPVKAAEYYTNAAMRNDPHAIFNLGFLVEQGVRVPYEFWQKLRIKKHAYTNNITLLNTLYSRCSESYKSEAYIPCSIAYYRVQFVDLWDRYHLLVKLSTILGIIMATTAVLSSIYTYFRTRQINVDAV